MENLKIFFVGFRIFFVFFMLGWGKLFNVEIVKVLGIVMVKVFKIISKMRYNLESNGDKCKVFMMLIRI